MKFSEPIRTGPPPSSPATSLVPMTKDLLMTVCTRLLFKMLQYLNSCRSPHRGRNLRRERRNQWLVSDVLLLPQFFFIPLINIPPKALSTPLAAFRRNGDIQKFCQRGYRSVYFGHFATNRFWSRSVVFICINFIGWLLIDGDVRVNRFFNNQ